MFTNLLYAPRYRVAGCRPLVDTAGAAKTVNGRSYVHAMAHSLCGNALALPFFVHLGNERSGIRTGNTTSRFQETAATILGRVVRKRNERISTTPFLLSPGDKIENCSAQFLAICWIVHVEFQLHRPRDGISVSNALLLDQSLLAFIGHNLDQIGDGTLL